MSNDRVDRTVFPRPDFPEQGWIGKPTQTLFEAANGTYVGGIYDLAYVSFRMPDSRKDKTFIWQDVPRVDWLGSEFAVSFDPATLPGIYALLQTLRIPGPEPSNGERSLLYTDFPEQGWIGKVPLSLYEAFLWDGINQDTYRTDDRKQDKTYLRQDQPQFDWLNNVIALFNAPSGIAAVYQILSTFRTPDRKQDRTFILQDQPDYDWLNNILFLFDVPFNVPSASQLLDTYRASDRKQDHTFIFQDQPSFSWLTAQLKLWETWYFVGPRDQANVFRTKESSADRFGILLGQPELAWIYYGIPVGFDPTLFPSIQALLQSFRTNDRKQDRTLILQGQPETAWFQIPLVLFNAINATAQLLASFRMSDQRRDKTLILQDQPLFDWLQVLQLWEKSYFSSTHDELQAYRMPNRAVGRFYPSGDYPEIDWISSVLFPAFDPKFWPGIHYLLQSFRTPNRRSDITLILQDSPEFDWINAVLKLPFDPTLWSSIEQRYKYLFASEKWNNSISVFNDFPELAWLFQLVSSPPAPIVISLGKDHHYPSPGGGQSQGGESRSYPK